MGCHAACHEDLSRYCRAWICGWHATPGRLTWPRFRKQETINQQEEQEHSHISRHDLQPQNSDVQQQKVVIRRQRTGHVRQRSEQRVQPQPQLRADWFHSEQTIWLQLEQLRRQQIPNPSAGQHQIITNWVILQTSKHAELNHERCHAQHRGQHGGQAL